MLTKTTIMLLAALSFPFSATAAEISAQTFAEKAAQSDMFETESAKLALEKGKSEEVKTFAQTMMKDHGESTKALKEAAAKDGVKLPTEMGDDLKAKLESLKPLSGPQLDTAYISTQVAVHSDAVDLFDKYSKNGQAGAIKSFAQSTYPTIRMHLIKVRGFKIDN